MKKKIELSDMNQPEDILPPFLKNNSVIEPFRVPEGYFDTLPGKIQEKILSIKKEKQVLSWYRSLFTVRKAWIPLLAAASIIAAAFFLLPANKKASIPLANITDTLNLKSAYDASYASEAIIADYAEIEKTISDPAFNRDNSISLIQVNDSTITDEGIIDYLKDQDLDNDLLAQL